MAATIPGISRIRVDRPVAESSPLAREGRMIDLGQTLMDIRQGCPYTLPILAGGGLSAASLAAIDWTRATSQATGALALAGLVGGSVVGGIVYGINKYDQVRINRQKLYEEANRASLTAQMAESIANQEKMRDSLHALRNDAEKAHSENANLRDDLATLRKQFLDVSTALRETDKALHETHEELRKTRLEFQHATDRLMATERDRDALRTELESIRKTQAAQSARLGALELVTPSGSGDSIPALKPGPPK